MLGCAAVRTGPVYQPEHAHYSQYCNDLLFLQNTFFYNIFPLLYGQYVSYRGPICGFQQEFRGRFGPLKTTLGDFFFLLLFFSSPLFLISLLRRDSHTQFLHHSPLSLYSSSSLSPPLLLALCQHLSHSLLIYLPALLCVALAAYCFSVSDLTQVISCKWRRLRSRRGTCRVPKCFFFLSLRSH